MPRKLSNAFLRPKTFASICIWNSNNLCMRCNECYVGLFQLNFQYLLRFIIYIVHRTFSLSIYAHVLSNSYKVSESLEPNFLLTNLILRCKECLPSKNRHCRIPMDYFSSVLYKAHQKSRCKRLRAYWDETWGVCGVGSPPRPRKFAVVSQGKNGSTKYICGATYCAQDHWWATVTKKRKTSQTKNVHRATSDTPKTCWSYVPEGLHKLSDYLRSIRIKK